MSTFRDWLKMNEDGDLNSWTPDIDAQKKPMRMSNPLALPPANREGRKIEKKFGINRKNIPRTRSFTAVDHLPDQQRGAGPMA